MISFLLNDKPVTIDQIDPNTSLQNYVRNTLGLTGTKEGCASGDCGACTLVVAELNKQKNALSYKTVNSCITLLTSLHGKQLITVEHLSTKETLHPVQQAMVDHHGSQCGFCTPGFIMSMFSLYKEQTNVTRTDVEHALSGNLCRCTGYRPIIDATLRVCNEQYTPDQFDQQQQATIEALKKIESSCGIEGLIKPNNRQQLIEAINQFPDGRLVSGATDLALEITQNLHSFDQLISLCDVAELNQLHEHEDGIEMGAALTLNQVLPVLTQHYPQLEELIIRFASLPIRNQATIGGNIANASPIGDLPPVLLALGASIRVDNGERQRTIPADEFFIGYRQTQLEEKEWINSIFLPFISCSAKLAAYKVSKRIEDDISAVCAVFHVEVENDRIIGLKTGFGGVAATPVQAVDFEQNLIGLTLSASSTRDLGASLLNEAFTPLSDVRASAEYRSDIVANLWRRFWYQHTQSHIQTRISQCVN